jgi:hypothetical protein
MLQKSSKTKAFFGLMKGLLTLQQLTPHGRV